LNPLATYQVNTASQMRFSVIIPTFRRAQLLGDAIGAALAQTHTNREILVVDDGSPDDTRSVASTFGEAVRYFRQENKGKSAALNLGISASTGDAIIVLDDDDLFPPWTLAKHAEALERNAAADFSFGRFARFHCDQPPLSSDLKDEELIPTHDPRRLVIKLMENCFLPNPTWAVRREAQTRVGLYDETMHRSADYDMILRLARKNEGVFIDDLVLYQRKHLGFRGPSTEETFEIDSVSKWVKYDSLLFSKLDREWSLSDFRPFSNETRSMQQEALALIQKGVILFRRKVYDGAMRALSKYGRHLCRRSPGAVELRIASGLLGCRYGITDLVKNRSLSSDIIQAFRSIDWPLAMRIAFALQTRWRVRAALTSGDMGYALDLVKFSCRAFGPSATTAVLGSRLKLGTDEWKNRN
jgi:glycosyltransferase involved in cell wall biosynthesis